MDDKKKMEDFYNALSDSQKNRVEMKLKNILRESFDSLPENNVKLIRYQIASDMFQILKG